MGDCALPRRYDMMPIEKTFAILVQPCRCEQLFLLELLVRTQRQRSDLNSSGATRVLARRAEQRDGQLGTPPSDHRGAPRHMRAFCELSADCERRLERA